MPPKTSKRIAFLLLVLLGVSALQQSQQIYALSSRRELSQFAHQAWSTENGLPQNTVHAIVQTADGYIWVATEEGLARFDGISFTVFEKDNTPQLRSSDIRALMQDSKGALWIGTTDGLVQLFAGKFSAFTTQEGLPGNNIQSLSLDHNGNLWVATTSGLAQYRDGTFANFVTQPALPTSSVQTVFEDREGTLWIGTPYGLSRFKDGKLVNYVVPEGAANNSVVSINEDKDGRLWFGTLDGLTCLEQGRSRTYKTQDGLPSNRIISLLPDREGSLWIGTANGLVRLAGDKFTSFKPGSGLSSNIILSMLEDREGSLWVGTESGGLSLLKDTKFTTYSAADGLAGDLVKSVYEDQQGGLWIGTNGAGLSLFKDGKFTTYTTKDGLSSNVVLALFGDQLGNLWAGTPDGLSRFNKGKFTTYTSADGLSNDFVRSVYADREGNLWVGTRGGLTKLRDGNFKTFTTLDGLPNDFVGAIHEDANGSLWIGTLGGLSKFKDDRFTTYTTKDGLSSDTVLSLYEDSSGTLWIGTNGGGLNRLKDGKFEVFTTTAGLPDDVVYRVLDDQRGSLWLASGKGIFRVEKKVLDDFASGKAKVITFTTYGTADGMATRECSGGGHPSAWRGRDGKLWFSTIKGVAMIDPGDIKINEQPPPVVIDQVRIDNESITPGQRIELPPGKSRFDFYYSALSFIAPEKVSFRYRLENFDPDWVDPGTRRSASYTNLPPGNYRFRVIARNNDGVWNQTGAVLDLRLRPYFYQTYWFYALCVLALALLVWLAYRFRVKQMESQFAAVLAERNRIAREIHDNLAQELLGVSVQLEVLARTMPATEAATSQLNRIRMLVRHGIAEARRYVWDLRSQALENNDLPTALADTARRLTADSEVEAKVEVNGTFRPLGELVETNLLRIGQEAINNAVKHAEARRILINLQFESRRVRLSVQDNGRGFDEKRREVASGSHFGLTGMRERAEQIGGTFAIHTGNGSGTEVVIDVPISD
jgi:ligand-binding sensor domain-containing protein/signal transduction histidine kinase